MQCAANVTKRADDETGACGVAQHAVRSTNANAMSGRHMVDDASKLGERFGSGDGERKTLLTRQIAFEPLPASVLFGLGWLCGSVMSPVVSESSVWLVPRS